MKYKVGQKVIIRSLEWYNKHKDGYEDIRLKETCFRKIMALKFCGKVMTISAFDDYKDGYRMLEDKGEFFWTDEMIEGLVEEETNDCEKCGLIHNSTRCLFMDNCPHSKQKNIIEIPEDYVIKDENGNVINTTKIVLEKKKKEYPKTYDECCKVLGLLNVDLCFNADYRSFDASKEQWKRLGLMNQFYQLLICRDAYWKLYGEEMGLGKPWEPGDNKVFGIIRQNGKIQKYHDFVGGSTILEFPTEEMRDAFYENFKELIEQCKELL